jgi:TM2 domain-containing membrane protein YozV
MLTMLATEKPPASAASSPPPTTSLPVPTLSPHDAVKISVMENGRTTLYDLASAPTSIREQIGNAWGFSPRFVVPPVITRAPEVCPALPMSTARPRTLRFAMTLNLFVPGAGQFYLGQRISGLVYAGAFGACLVATLVLFVRAYSQYMQLATNADILESGNLESMARAFQVGPLATLSVIGTLIYIVSAIHLVVAHNRQRPAP